MKRTWFMAAAVLAVAGCSSKATPQASTSTTAAPVETTAAPTTTSTSTTAKPPPTTVAPLAVGSTATTAGFDATVFAVTDPLTFTGVDAQVNRLGDGNRFVAVDVQMKNVSAESPSFSGLNGFILIDSENHRYELTITSKKPGAPDGDIQPGDASRGFAVFEIPKTSTGLSLLVKGSFTATGVVFKLA